MITCSVIIFVMGVGLILVQYYPGIKTDLILSIYVDVL